MENENLAGLSAGIGTDIRILLNNAGIDPSACPLPPTTLDMADGVLHLPKSNALLSSFSAVNLSVSVCLFVFLSVSFSICLSLLTIHLNVSRTKIMEKATVFSQWKRCYTGSECTLG